MIISETHLINKIYAKIPAIIIRNNTKHHLHSKTTFDYLQATTVSLEILNRPIQMSAIYPSPKHKFTPEYENFFQTLGNKFLVVEDYNAKYNLWGSKRELVELYCK